MGWIRSLAYRQSSNAELVGFASRSEAKRRGDFTSIRGGFGPPGEHIDTSELIVGETLEDLLAEDSIDLIDICLPAVYHADAIQKTFAAGKRVLCEKPLALDTTLADQLTTLSNGGDLMVAHTLPFVPPYAYLLEAAADGRFGRCVTGRFDRTISPPERVADYYDPKGLGGPLVDLQVDDAQMIRLLFGTPAAAHTASHRMPRPDLPAGVPKRYETVFEYPDFDEEYSGCNQTTIAGGEAVTSFGPVVSVGGGVTDSPGRRLSQGFEVGFHHAVLRYEMSLYGDGSIEQTGLTILHADGRVERPAMPGDDPIAPYRRQIDAAAAVVAGGPLPSSLDPAIATDAIRICEMQMPTSNQVAP